MNSRMRHVTRLVVLFLLLFTIAATLFGCPSAGLNISGAWSGEIVAQFTGMGELYGTIQIQAIQEGTQVYGTWTDYFTETGSNGGNFSGRLIGRNITALFSPSNPGVSCPFQVTGEVSEDGDTMTGVYTALFCPVGQSGSFSLSRR